MIQLIPPDQRELGPGEERKEITILGESYQVIIQGPISPFARPDLAPWIDQRLKFGRFFGSGGNGVAICDYTPTKVGTKRKLGAF